MNEQQISDIHNKHSKTKDVHFEDIEHDTEDYLERCISVDE